MLKRLLGLLSTFILIFSVTSINSFAGKPTYYGAFYNANDNTYEIYECNKDEKADFIMRFKYSEIKDKLLNHIKKSINKRLNKWGRFPGLEWHKFFSNPRFRRSKKVARKWGNYLEDKWTSLFSGPYNNLPNVAGYDRHHIMSNSFLKCNKFNHKMAPAASLRIDLHKKTGSYGSSHDAYNYRQEEIDVYSKDIRNLRKVFEKGLDDMNKVISDNMKLIVDNDIKELNKSICEELENYINNYIKSISSQDLYSISETPASSQNEYIQPIFATILI